MSLSLRNSIQDLQADPENKALRQKYCDGLSSVHEEVFHEPAKLFKKYFYIQCAHDLTRGGFAKYPGPRLRLLSSAATVVKTEKAFQDAVLRDDGSSLEAFPLFMEKYTVFAHQLFEELREIYSLSPFFFKERYAITVCWFQSIVEMLAKERVGFSELFETRDPSALSMIFRIGILRWIAEPEGEVPEIFRGQNDLETMREQYFALSQHAQKRLENVLMGIEEIDGQNPEFTLFIAIGKLKAELESNARLCNILFHTLALQNV